MLTIHYEDRDITTVEYGIIGHGVNGQLKMNSGVARAIRNKWPIVYSRYMRGPYGKDSLGKAIIVPVEDNLVVANMYTQEFYGYDGRRYACPDAIERSFNVVINYAVEFDLPIYLPKIGSALGGLEWEADVIPALNRATGERDVRLTVCIY